MHVRRGMVYGSLALCGANIIGAIMFLPCLPFTLASGMYDYCYYILCICIDDGDEMDGWDGWMAGWWCGG